MNKFLRFFGLLFLPLIMVTSSCALDKEKMKIDIEVYREFENAYVIIWEDTLGSAQGYDVLDRPLELKCHILNSKNDTVGYYRGLSMPGQYAYFDLNDTIYSFHFSKGINIFSELFENEKEGKIFWEKNNVPIEYEPFKLNINPQSRIKMEIELVEK